MVPFATRSDPRTLALWLVTLSDRQISVRARDTCRRLSPPERAGVETTGCSALHCLHFDRFFQYPTIKPIRTSHISLRPAASGLTRQPPHVEDDSAILDAHEKLEAKKEAARRTLFY